MTAALVDAFNESQRGFLVRWKLGGEMNGSISLKTEAADEKNLVPRSTWCLPRRLGAERAGTTQSFLLP